MGTFTFEESKHYEGNRGTGASYFSLKNDRDVATVRFLYRDASDVEGFAVHQIEVDGRKRYVNCLRNYDDPISKCPFCEARVRQQARVFIPIYNVDEGKVQIWERGVQFLKQLSSLFERYNKADIVQQEFEIERNGRAGDTNTTYQIFRTDKQPDNARVEDFEIPDVLNTIVLDKNADEMRNYLETKSFDSAVVPRRRDAEPQDNRDYEEVRPRRRVPNDEAF